jgi:hypothetical protein
MVHYLLFVSLLLLVSKYCPSRHDGTIRILSTSHSPFCMRLILLGPFILLFFSHCFGACCCLWHIYDHLIWARYVRFLCLTFSIFYLVTIHINTNRHDTSLPLSHPFPSRCWYCRYRPLRCCKDDHRCTFIVQLRTLAFCWCNTISPHWADRWAPMLMLLYSPCVRCEIDCR